MQSQSSSRPRTALARLQHLLLCVRGHGSDTKGREEDAEGTQNRKGQGKSYKQQQCAHSFALGASVGCSSTWPWNTVLLPGLKPTGSSTAMMPL